MKTKVYRIDEQELPGYETSVIAGSDNFDCVAIMRLEINGEWSVLIQGLWVPVDATSVDWWIPLNKLQKR